MAEKPKKALFLLIDAMRYDVLSDPVARRFLFPNMARLIDRGFVRRVVTNAQSTQFVMPSLFSLSYPLDYDARLSAMNSDECGVGVGWPGYVAPGTAVAICHATAIPGETAFSPGH